MLDKTLFEQKLTNIVHTTRTKKKKKNVDLVRNLITNLENGPAYFHRDYTARPSNLHRRALFVQHKFGREN